ncbi:TfuA-like protein [Alsobacter sp. KACC 23698]|uniref:TfuA-like protein n=1 Tax=Alsobacter sp. KACC 23698 TaxID=3149229 RepID=A0AAU7J9B1_9HYPH
MSGLIFLGPTLAAEEARDMTRLRVLPPAAQGDLYRAVLDHRPRAVGLVDGYFHQVPSVWHREILWAISQGVAVFGAASMGALRACELQDFGMVGVGRVFEGFAAGRYAPFGDDFENDDEVAVLHGPPETGFLRLSDALVDLRQGLAEAEAAGAIGPADRDRLAARLRELPYGERSADAVLEAGVLTDVAAARLQAWWRASFESQKRRDAVALIARMEAWLASGQTPAPPGFVFQRSGVWEAFVADEAARRAAALTPDEALVVDDLQLDPERWAGLCRAAGRDGASGREARVVFDEWRRRRGLDSRAALLGWMAENGLDEAGLTALFDRVARRGGVHVTPAGPREAIDHLRIAGDFATALGGARRRAALLAGAPPVPAAESRQLRAIAERRGLIDDSGLAVEPLAEAAERLCYPSEQAFARALWRMYHLERAGGQTPGGADGG